MIGPTRNELAAKIIRLERERAILLEALIRHLVGQMGAIPEEIARAQSIRNVILFWLDEPTHVRTDIIDALGERDRRADT
jgi:hypothetical protein